MQAEVHQQERIIKITHPWLWWMFSSQTHHTLFYELDYLPKSSAYDWLEKQNEDIITSPYLAYYK